MATTNLVIYYSGVIKKGTGNGVPDHNSSIHSLYTDLDDGTQYKNTDGATAWSVADVAQVSFNDEMLFVSDSSGGLNETDIRHKINDVTRAPKMDIGNYDVDGGLDMGTGGSFFQDEAGVVVVKVFQFDNSAVSGSKFTEVSDLNAQHTWLDDDNDALYVGLPKKFWAARFEIGVAKSSETLMLEYWDGSVMQANTYSCVEKTDSVLIGNVFLEGTPGDTEYIQWDHTITDWIAVDDQADVIPDTGTDLFWIRIRNPGIIATPPRTDEIRVRRSDTDSVTGKGQLVFWGEARPEKAFRKDFNSVVKVAANPKILEQPITSTIDIPLYEFRNNNTDAVQITVTVGAEVDTGMCVALSLVYYSDDAGEIDWDIAYKFLKQGTAVGGGESNTESFSVSTTPSAAGEWQTDVDLTGANNQVDISTLMAGDDVAISIGRNGSTDTNSGVVFPATLVLKFFSRAEGAFGT